MAIYLLAFLCVLLIAGGQILFKLSADELTNSNTILSYKVMYYFFSAVIIYAVTTIGWVYILKKIELGRIYPFTALAFIFVPLGSYYFLGERFQPQYYVGVVLIIAGIFLASRT